MHKCQEILFNIMYIKEKKEDYTIVRNEKANAEIELTNITELNEILNGLIESGEKKIVIDFKNIVYIDSSGLGTMMAAMKKLKKRDGELGILSISKEVLEVFTATKIAQFFKFYKSQ